MYAAEISVNKTFSCYIAITIDIKENIFIIIVMS